MVLKRIVLITSTKDPASSNMRKVFLDPSFTLRSNIPFFEETTNSYDGFPIFKSLVKYFSEDLPDTGNNSSKSSEFIELELLLYTTNNDLVTLDNFENIINADLFLYISKHSSASELHSFSVHSCGNWGDSADLGGKPKSICPTNPYLQTILLKQFFSSIESFNDKNDINFEIVLEATHHGPLSNTPLLFIEIGSSLNEWSKKENAEFVVENIYSALSSYGKLLLNEDYKKIPLAIGVGGPHYTPILTKYILRNEIFIGHVIPKYAIENLEINLFEKAFTLTPFTNTFLLDWKGLTKCKEKITSFIEIINDSKNFDSFESICPYQVVKIK